MNSVASQQLIGQIAGTGADEVSQHGSLGDFIRMEIEDFIRCIYKAKRQNDHTVTLVCEKDQLCCQHGCCPKDQHWMTGVYVLLSFCLLVFIIGVCASILCYIKSKKQGRDEFEEEYQTREAINSKLTYRS